MMNDVTTKGTISAVVPSTVTNSTSNPDAASQTFDREELFLKMREEYKGFVRDAIWQVLEQCFDLGADWGTLLEIECDVWSKVFESFEEWRRPGFGLAGRKPAKLSTRLSAYARLQAMGWKKAELRKGAKFATCEDGEKIEGFLYLKFTGRGRLYPENLKPRPLDETPERLKRTKNPVAFDHAAKFLCAECRALKALREGVTVAVVPDPAFELECGHVRRLSGSVTVDRPVRVAA
ncbi:MAG TPA: hypothetical protein VGN01_16315 [Acidobacteriaceae bacterium]|jgi:hypothetical protein